MAEARERESTCFDTELIEEKNLVSDFKGGSDSLKVNLGLSAYGEQHEAVSGSFGELLEFGRKNVPKEQWGETEIRLMATAGLRLLDVEWQDKILGDCRKVLRVSGFKFYDDWAWVITVADSLHKEMNIDPCTPKGYLPHSLVLSLDFMAEKCKCRSEHQARGNFLECRFAALRPLRKETRNVPLITVIWGQFSCLSFKENFWLQKVSSIPRRLCQRAFLSDLMMGGQHFCGEDWSKLKKKRQSLDEEELLRYCSSSAISFSNQVNIPLYWALGAFILQTTAKLDVQQSDWITTIISNDSPTLFSTIAISTISTFVAWSISKWRKP